MALAPPDEIAVKPSDETIALFSNRCGLAADFCIAAPGHRVSAAYFGPDSDGSGPIRSIDTLSGTSLAAPMVSGGFAIMKQLFRDQLSSEELVTRLLETADNTGLYANRTIYGRGKLDLAAATHPVGVPAVPVSTNTHQGGYDLHTTHLSLGAPFGSGLGSSVLDREFMALDDLGAPFWYRLGDFIASAPDSRGDTTVLGFLANRFDSGAWQPGARTLLTTAATEGGHLSLTDGGMMATFTDRSGLSASVFGASRSYRERGASGGALSWRAKGAPLGIRVGWITEDETLLGGAGQGAFGSLSADTVFVGLESDARIGAWLLGAGAEWGSVRPQARGGIIEEISTLTTSAFALRARTTLPNRDKVGVSLSQPLRVEHGRASLALPVARTKVGRGAAHDHRRPPCARCTADRSRRDLGTNLGGRSPAPRLHLEPRPRPRWCRQSASHVSCGLAAGVLSVRPSPLFTPSESLAHVRGAPEAPPRCQRKRCGTAVGKARVSSNLPGSLTAAEDWARRDDVSLDHFIAWALAEKVGAKNAATFLEQRGQGGDLERTVRCLEAWPE